MPFKCSECGQESKFASLSVCHQNKKQSFQKLKELLVCKSCEKKAQHKICIQHHEAAKTMGDAFDRKVEQITCDELPEIREELYEFGKKLNDKVNLIRARNKEMWDEIYGKTGNIEYAMNLLERTLDVDEEVQQVKELLKKIEKKLKQEITSNQNVNRTMSSASFEEMNGSSVELIPDDYIPPPPYEEADCDLVNRSSPESANPLRP
ncbi:unnamed protein product, partial [Mesorhabditis belari]|uniref:Uncharacterized protein n=1 Tax=Mesorhabditis belari TaxID=2138241 RepID=A0AAF3ETU4_9BILA